jgi:hypothetical protein
MHETAIIQNRFGQLDETAMRTAWSARTEGTNVAG